MMYFHSPLTRLAVASLCILLAGLLYGPEAEAQSGQPLHEPSFHETLLQQPSLDHTTAYTVQYRPSDASYEVASFPHFDVIYERGAEPTADAIGRVLEQNRPVVDSLVGLGDRSVQMPVVVNASSDRSGGFVRTFPFKQEIESVSFKSDALTSYFSSWPAVVAPHELVHAAHAEVNPGFGVGGVLRPFMPDVSRALNLGAPRGFVEGIAVYYESQLEERAGRINAPLATMAYRAAMASDEPWSFTEMMHAPAFTRPFDRHYIGGGQAFQHLVDQEEGLDFFRRTTRWYHRFPVLGYGAALWYGVGDSPGEINREVQTELIAREQDRIDALGSLSEPEVVSSATGREYRRPYWLDDETLVAYAQGYSERRGFYRIDAQSGTRDRIRTHAIAEDYRYTLSRDSSTIHVGRYAPDPFADGVWKAQVESIDVESGQSERLSRDRGALAPVEAPDGTLWAIQNDGSYTQWARVEDDGQVTPVTDLDQTRVRQIAPSPNGTTVAALLNIEGDQALYRASLSDGTPEFTPWIAFDNAAIYDVSWGPDSRYLLFSADPNDVANIFAYDIESNQVLQLTNVPFGALEPALSPDGSSLAFVNYQHERFDLVRKPFRPETAEEVTDDLLADAAPVGSNPTPNPTVEPFEGIDTQPYRAWRYLAPRMGYPTLAYDIENRPLRAQDTDLGLGVGAAVEGADPLQQWAYRAEASYRAGRPWGTMAVRSTRFLLRPSVSVYNEPFTRLVADEEFGSRRVAIEERGAEMGLQLPVRLASNVYQTAVRPRVSMRFRQTRVIDSNADALSGFATRFTLNPGFTLNYRLQANRRDLMPNSGIVWSNTAQVDAWTDGPSRRWGLVSTLNAYLPLLESSNTGIRLGASLLTQNRPVVFQTDRFVPRGYENRALGEGEFVRFDAEVLQPLWYVDDGSMLLPVYFEAFYTYGFGQRLQSVRTGASLRSAGGGLGVRLRAFYGAQLDLRFGVSYRVGPGDTRFVGR